MLNSMGVMVLVMLHASFERPAKVSGGQPANSHDAMRLVDRVGDRGGNDHQDFFRHYVVVRGRDRGVFFDLTWGERCQNSRKNGYEKYDHRQRDEDDKNAHHGQRYPVLLG